MATLNVSFEISEVRASSSTNKPDLPISKHPYVSLLNFYIYQKLEICIPTDDCDYIMHVPEVTVQHKILEMDQRVILSNSANDLAAESMSHLLTSNGVTIPKSKHEEVFESVSNVARKLMIENNGKCPGIMSIDVFMETKVTQIMEYDEFAAAMAGAAIEEEFEFEPMPATKSSIETLEKVEFNGSKSTNQSCTICMDEFEFGLEVTKLPCSHLYHRNCIVQWLETSHLCPLCRFPMPHDS